MRDTDEHDPSMSPGDDGRYLILDLPPMTDEAAYQLSELLRRLWEAFDEAYDEQLRRAYRKHDAAREKLFHERCFLEAQQWLPFEGDDLP